MPGVMLGIIAGVRPEITAGLQAGSRRGAGAGGKMRRGRVPRRAAGHTPLLRSWEGGRIMGKVASLCLVLVLICTSAAFAEAPLSEKTEACIACHATVHPGLVADWENSPHALVTPGEALKRPALERRISAEKAPAGLADVAVGCAECHTLNPKKHQDTFEHAGFQVHVVVTPADCAVCHPVEDGEYKGNIMSHAYGNLKRNPVYQNLMDTINAVQVFKDDAATPTAPDALTEADSCLFCHGTVVKAGPLEARETDLGEMEFPPARRLAQPRGGAH